jgi:hypothetical protein
MKCLMKVKARYVASLPALQDSYLRPKDFRPGIIKEFELRTRRISGAAGGALAAYCSTECQSELQLLSQADLFQLIDPITTTFTNCFTTFASLLSCRSFPCNQIYHPFRNMSSSITIPSRSAYGESSKAGSVSSYSNSPQTPHTSTQRANATSPASASSTPTYGHDRRPSLLSKSYFYHSLLWVLEGC